ncbi:glycosyltransferase family 25 protein [Pseudoalteromonas sp. T1lg22]|uniref:glycosyltransferase family 25 protein n=2 Tax=unclassified Pseudoalteromonas TaxID=194690 RepID=UPI000CF6329E|nr:glycosyltransferase family 25 protein [Pseudoalteromonas sp. T1lg22]
MRNKRLYYKPLSNGEIACVLSHKKALQKFLLSDADFLFLLEDDAELDPTIHSFLKAVCSKSHWHLIKLYNGKKPKPALKTAWLDKQHALCYPKKVPNSTLAQLVTKAGAQKMLCMYEGFYMPADISLQSWWLHNLNILVSKNNLVTPYGCDSEIDKLAPRKSTHYSTSKRLRHRTRFEWQRLMAKPDFSVLEQFTK